MSDDELTCPSMVELVTEYLEDALPARVRARFERHLAPCEGCDRYIAQIRKTVELTGRVPDEPLPLEAMQRLIDAFRDFPRG